MLEEQTDLTAKPIETAVGNGKYVMPRFLQHERLPFRIRPQPMSI